MSFDLYFYKRKETSLSGNQTAKYLTDNPKQQSMKNLVCVALLCLAYLFSFSQDTARRRGAIVDELISAGKQWTFTHQTGSKENRDETEILNFHLDVLKRLFVQQQHFTIKGFQNDDFPVKIIYEGQYDEVIEFNGITYFLTIKNSKPREMALRIKRENEDGPAIDRYYREETMY